MAGCGTERLTGAGVKVQAEVQFEAAVQRMVDEERERLRKGRPEEDELMWGWQGVRRTAHVEGRGGEAQWKKHRHVCYHGVEQDPDPQRVAAFSCSRFAFRGLLVDTGRRFLPLSTLKHAVDLMAQNKLNVLHWHIVDVESFPAERRLRFPRLSGQGAFHPSAVYTQRV